MHDLGQPPGVHQHTKSLLCNPFVLRIAKTLWSLAVLIATGLRCTDILSWGVILPFSVLHPLSIRWLNSQQKELALLGANSFHYQLSPFGMATSTKEAKRKSHKLFPFSQMAEKNIHPIALRKAKIVCNVCLSECNRAEVYPSHQTKLQSQ